ncbi:P-loop NTPase fold protein [Flavobacterium sp. YJ01]|uniref:KAP family P-loop NTPase fold protein n=1 Tax=Flavobacterium sp. YJ01 TaxID=3031997 RepID=UPI0023E3934B|nr:P-loop NTPase fold protein [Flavobacterium sp. YJ01]WET03912.1 P-loop NTPase fold protein [Flavobacterium sp. YJ01]
MRKKTENFIEIIYSSFSRKRVLILIAVIFFYFAYQSKIENFIELNLLIDKNFSNPWLDFVLLFISIYFSIFFFYKINNDRYVPSYNELVLGLLFVFNCFYYLFNSSKLNWEFTSTQISTVSFKYIYFLLAPIIVFLTSFFLRFIFISFSSVKPKPLNNLFDDSPISDTAEDELDYSEIVKKLKEVLIGQTSDKSFTIGLVGPWGNGKSSIIKMVKSEIEPKISFFERILAYLKFSNNKDLIVINFMPYLNHKEEDIISEFFTSLSKELSKFNGKLANQILEYSKRLTNIYKENKLIELFENISSKSADTPSKHLYDQINIRLKEVGKKIIVFIDDLDRLNENEILEVLKLIRNTADFNNTIFVVAMDKDYVINRLKINHEILDSKFIDKFFQLEIYLPELESIKLQEYFVKLLLKFKEKFNSDFELRLNNAMKNNFNLFNLYVKNFRDVKRVANQIIFEYPFFEKELDLKDFLNFTYFKLKFPKFVKVLNDNRNSFLEIDQTGKFYRLAEKEDENGKRPKQKLNILKNKNYGLNNFSNLDRYLIFEKLKANDSVNDLINGNNIDIDLLLKSLVSLFGDENKMENKHSIKFENNFRKLMQQKYLSTDLLQEEYQMLFKNSRSIENDLMQSRHLLPYELIEKLYQEKKIKELLSRFDYFNSNESSDIKWTILILGILLEKRKNYQLQFNEILILVNTFIQKLIDIQGHNKIYLDKWLITNFFDNVLSTQNRLILYQQILLNDNLNNYRSLSNKDLSTIILNSFKEYILELKNKADYTVDDFSIYDVYHAIKDADGIADDVRKTFISFWNAENIEILCIHMIDFGLFSGISYTLKKITTDIFGSPNNFFNFVEGLKTNTNEKIITEFIQLYKLISITNYSLFIVFEFKQSLKMIKIVNDELKKSIRSRNSEDSFTQVFFESNNLDMMNKLVSDIDLESQYGRLFLFTYEDKFYLIINLNNPLEIYNIRQVLSEKIIKKLHTESDLWEREKLTRKNLFDGQPFFKSTDSYIKIFSIQSNAK